MWCVCIARGSSAGSGRNATCALRLETGKPSPAILALYRSSGYRDPPYGE